MAKFHKKNRGKLLYVIDGDSPKKILEDLLGPYHEKTVFKDHRDHYSSIYNRINNYFAALHSETIQHMSGDDRAFDRLFDQFRSILIDKVPLICESIELWYKRAEQYRKETFSVVKTCNTTSPHTNKAYPAPQ